MRLYSRTDASAIDAPEGHFTAGKDGAFDLPEELGRRLHGFHAGGMPHWETDIERQHRLIQEEAARRADPRTLLEAVEKLVAQAEAAPPAPAKPAPKTAPKAPAKA